jgi:predicted Zn-ribbon and HTH transcriptional regulator
MRFPRIPSQARRIAGAGQWLFMRAIIKPGAGSVESREKCFRGILALRIRAAITVRESAYIHSHSDKDHRRRADDVRHETGTLSRRSVDLLVGPFLCRGLECGLMLRPVVESRRIKIRSRFPHQCVNLGIDAHLCKHCWISERPKKFSMKHRLEIDRAHQSILKPDPQTVWSCLLKRFHSMERMAHSLIIA